MPYQQENLIVQKTQINQVEQNVLKMKKRDKLFERHRRLFEEKIRAKAYLLTETQMTEIRNIEN